MDIPLSPPPPTLALGVRQRPASRCTRLRACTIRTVCVCSPGGVVVRGVLNTPHALCLCPIPSLSPHAAPPLLLTPSTTNTPHDPGLLGAEYFNPRRLGVGLLDSPCPLDLRAVGGRTHSKSMSGPSLDAGEAHVRAFSGARASAEARRGARTWGFGLPRHRREEESAVIDEAVQALPVWVERAGIRHVRSHRRDMG